jgi:hypothetical protein
MRALRSIGLAICVTLLVVPLHADESKKPGKRPANRLAKETSPYLLLHAHNPVEWYPWGPEAFARAKKENKLIFLSIGYSSCYWCHVMERQSFMNEAIAKIMNEKFVCIKVDREERPDVDHIYMTALHAQGSRGGWPLSMFLTPDGKPIGGGTYWPPEDREVEGQKVRGFKTILNLVNDDWTNQRKPLMDHADRLADAVNQSLALGARKLLFVKLDKSLVQEGVQGVKDSHDALHGGFGNKERAFRGPKFPTPPMLELLLTHYEQTKDEASLKIITHTLDRMAMGGIYDHLGGGFHRYSVDREWKVPHFEKMLYDNAQLASVYSKAYRLTRRPMYRRVVEETLAFIEREMTSPDGGFYSALDAESEEEEGKHYVWTTTEIDATLTKEEATLFKKVYGVDQGPNFEGKAHVLLLPRQLSDAAAELKLTEDDLVARLQPAWAKLLKVRDKRPRPLLDRKVLTSWNGLMISGYAEAAMALDQPTYARRGERAAEFVLKHLRTKDGRLLRTIGGGLTESTPLTEPAKYNAYLEDYSLFVNGLLGLHVATKQRRWLDEALALNQKMFDLFHDKEAGGFFFTSHDHEKLFARAKDQHDGAMPSGNSVAALNLVTLHRRTGEAKHRQQAEDAVRAFTASLKQSPDGMCTMVNALAMMLESAESGKPAAAEAKDEQVKLSATLAPADDAKQVVTVTLDIAKGWHAYANPASNDMLIPTSVQLAAKEKLEDVKVEYPKGKELKEPGTEPIRVYEGKVEIKVSFRRSTVNGKLDDSPIEAAVRYQVCDDKRCLTPKTVKVPVK